jgi:hypothetical protein
VLRNRRDAAEAEAEVRERERRGAPRMRQLDAGRNIVGCGMGVYGYRIRMMGTVGADVDGARESFFCHHD